MACVYRHMPIDGAGLGTLTSSSRWTKFQEVNGCWMGISTRTASLTASRSQSPRSVHIREMPRASHRSRRVVRYMVDALENTRDSQVPMNSQTIGGWDV